MKFRVHIIKSVEVEADSPRGASRAARLLHIGAGSVGRIYAVHPEFGPVQVVAECDGCDAFATEVDDMAALGWREDPEDGCNTCPDCAAKLDAEALAQVAATDGATRAAVAAVADALAAATKGGAL